MLSCGRVVGDSICEASHALHVVIVEAGEEIFSCSASDAGHEGLAFTLDRDPLPTAIGWRAGFEGPHPIGLLALVRYEVLP